MESDMHRSDEFQLMLYKQWAEQNDFLLCALQSTVLLEYRWHRHLIPLNLLDHKPLVMEPLNLLDLIEAKLCNFKFSFMQHCSSTFRILRRQLLHDAYHTFVMAICTSILLYIRHNKLNTKKASGAIARLVVSWLSHSLEFSYSFTVSAGAQQGV